MKKSEVAQIIEIESGLGIILPERFARILPPSLEHLECEVVNGEILIRMPSSEEEVIKHP